MTTTTTSQPHDTTADQPNLDPGRLAPNHPRRGHGSRRTGLTVAAVGTVTVTVAAVAAVGALASSSTTHTRSAPAPASAWSCSATGDDDSVRAAVDACLAFTGVSLPDARTSPFFVISAIPTPDAFPGTFSAAAVPVVPDAARAPFSVISAVPMPFVASTSLADAATVPFSAIAAIAMPDAGTTALP